MSDFSLKIKSSCVFKVDFGWVFNFLHGWLEITILQELSDNLTEFFLFSFVLGEFFDQSIFHDNQIVFKWNISFFTHVLSNNDSFDFVILSFEVFQSNAVKWVQHFEVFFGELGYSLKGFIQLFDENFVIAISCEGAGHWHVDIWSSPFVGTDDVADGFFKLVICKELITFSNWSIINLTIGDEDDIFEVFLFALFCNSMWWCSTSSILN